MSVSEQLDQFTAEFVFDIANGELTKAHLMTEVAVMFAEKGLEGLSGAAWDAVHELVMKAGLAFAVSAILSDGYAAAPGNPALVVHYRKLYATYLREREGDDE